MQELHLDLDGQGPLNAQLLRALKHAILARRLAPGARLPATRELSQALELSRNTVLAAYEQLAAEGFIEGRIGSGSYVASLADLPEAAPQPAGAPPASGVSRYAATALALRPFLPPGRERKPLRYNLEYGVPLVTPALQSAWRRALGRAADDTELDYPPAEGLPRLRTAIAGYLARRRGIVAQADDVIVVGGIQQGLDVCVRALLDRGERAAIEEPQYQGTRQALLAHGARLVTVPVDGDGMVVDELGRARLVCVTPSHQFPGGAVLALKRRLALLDWASRNEAWVLEDDYDGEYRYDVRPIAALKSLDRAQRVVYLGSFSKVMFPALRLGYIVAPPPLRDALRATKWLIDRGCAAIDQNALAELMESGQFERLLRRSARLLADRRTAMLRALSRHCGELLEIGGASAGMHLTGWLTRHSHSQVDEVVRACEKVGVGVYPIAPYFVKQPAPAGLLLGYSGLSGADIAEGVRRLGAVLREVVPAR